MRERRAARYARESPECRANLSRPLDRWACAALLAIAIVGCPGVGTASASAAAATPEQQLADRYAPVVMLKKQSAPCDSEGEQFVPAPVAVVLGNPAVKLAARPCRRADRVHDHRERTHGGAGGGSRRRLLPRSARRSPPPRLHLREGVTRADAGPQADHLRPRRQRAGRDRRRPAVLVLLVLQPVQRRARGRLGDDPARLGRYELGRRGARAGAGPDRPGTARRRRAGSLGLVQARARRRPSGGLPGVGIARELLRRRALSRHRPERRGLRLRRLARAIEPYRGRHRGRARRDRNDRTVRLAQLRGQVGTVRARAQQRPRRARPARPVARAVPMDGGLALVEPDRAARLDVRPERDRRVLRRDRGRLGRVQQALPPPRSDPAAGCGTRPLRGVPGTTNGLEPCTVRAARAVAPHRPDHRGRCARLPRARA